MDQNQQSDSAWVCMGSCQAVVSQEEYDKGLTACGAEGCTMHGKSFVKGKKDAATGQNVADNPADMPAGTA